MKEAGGVVYPSVTWKLRELEASKEHKLSLEDWSEESEEVGRSLDRHLESHEAAKSNLYELLGWSSVFQGVLIACIAQAQSPTCRKSFPLLILSGLNGLATFWATVILLKRISHHKDSHLFQRERLLQLRDRISGLREKGSDFNIAEALSEDLPGIQKITQSQGKS